jgi:hypothetical protein
MFGKKEGREQKCEKYFRHQKLFLDFINPSITSSIKIILSSKKICYNFKKYYKIGIEMEVDKACNNKICMKSDECARYQSYLDGNKDYKTFKGTETKGCGQFMQK